MNRSIELSQRGNPHLGNVSQSSQLAIQELARTVVGKGCRGAIVVRPIMPSEGIAAAPDSCRLHTGTITGESAVRNPSTPTCFSTHLRRSWPYSKLRSNGTETQH